MKEQFENITEEELLHEARILCRLTDLFCDRYRDLARTCYRTDQENDWFGFGDGIRDLTTKAICAARASHGMYAQLAFDERVRIVQATKEIVHVAAILWERQFGRPLEPLGLDDRLHGRVLPIGAVRT